MKWTYWHLITSSDFFWKMEFCYLIIYFITNKTVIYFDNILSRFYSNGDWRYNKKRENQWKIENHNEQKYSPTWRSWSLLQRIQKLKKWSETCERGRKRLFSLLGNCAHDIGDNIITLGLLALLHTVFAVSETKFRTKRTNFSIALLFFCYIYSSWNSNI